MSQLNSFIRDPKSLFTYIPEKGFMHPFNGDMVPIAPDGVFRDISNAVFVQAFGMIGVSDDFKLEIDMTMGCTHNKTILALTANPSDAYGNTLSPNMSLAHLVYTSDGVFRMRYGTGTTSGGLYLVPPGDTTLLGKIVRMTVVIVSEGLTVSAYLDGVLKGQATGSRRPYLLYSKTDAMPATSDVVYHSFKMENLTTGETLEYPQWENSSQLVNNVGIHTGGRYLTAYSKALKPCMLINTTLTGKPLDMTFIFAGRLPNDAKPGVWNCYTVTGAYPGNSNSEGPISLFFSHDLRETTNKFVLSALLRYSINGVTKLGAATKTFGPLPSDFYSVDHTAIMITNQENVTVYFDGVLLNSFPLEPGEKVFGVDSSVVAPTYAGRFPLGAIREETQSLRMNSIAEGRYYQCLLRCLADSEIKAVHSLLIQEPVKDDILVLETGNGALGVTASSPVDVLLEDGTLVSGVTGTGLQALQVKAGTTLIRGSYIQLTMGLNAASAVVDSSLDIAKIPRGVTHLQSGTKLKGRISDLPPNLHQLYVYQSGVSGSLDQLPKELVYLYMYCGVDANSQTIFGGTLPPLLKSLFLFFGDLDCALAPKPAGLTSLYLSFCKITNASAWDLQGVTTIRLYNLNGADFNISTAYAPNVYVSYGLYRCTGLNFTLEQVYGVIAIGESDIKADLNGFNIKGTSPTAQGYFSFNKNPLLVGTITADRMSNGFNNNIALIQCPLISPRGVRTIFESVLAKTQNVGGAYTLTYSSYYKEYISDVVDTLKNSFGWNTVETAHALPAVPSNITNVIQQDGNWLVSGTPDGHSIRVSAYSDIERTVERGHWDVDLAVTMLTVGTQSIPTSIVDAFGTFYISFQLVGYGGVGQRHDFPTPLECKSSSIFEWYCAVGDVIAYTATCADDGTNTLMAPDGTVLTTVASEVRIMHQATVPGWYRCATSTYYTHIATDATASPFDLAWLPLCNSATIYTIKGTAPIPRTYTRFSISVALAGARINLADLTSAELVSLFGSGQLALTGSVKSLAKATTLYLYNCRPDAKIRLADIPLSVVNLRLQYMQDVTGNLSDLKHPAFNVLYLWGSDIFGNTKDIPHVTGALDLTSVTYLTGDIADIRGTLKTLVLNNLTVYGDVNYLPASIVDLQIVTCPALNGILGGVVTINKTKLLLRDSPHLACSPFDLTSCTAFRLYTNMGAQSIKQTENCVSALVNNGKNNGVLTLPSYMTSTAIETGLQTLRSRGWEVTIVQETAPEPGSLFVATFEDENKPMSLHASLSGSGSEAVLTVYTDGTFSVVAHTLRRPATYYRENQLLVDLSSGAIPDEALGLHKYWSVRLSNGSTDGQSTSGQNDLILRSKTKALLPAVAGRLKLLITGYGQTFSAKLPDGTILTGSQLNIDRDITAGTLELTATDFSTVTSFLIYNTTTCFTSDVLKFLPDLRSHFSIHAYFNPKLELQFLPRITGYLGADYLSGDVTRMPEPTDTLTLGAFYGTGSFKPKTCPTRAFRLVCASLTDAVTFSTYDFVSPSEQIVVANIKTNGGFDISNALLNITLQNLVNATINLDQVNTNLAILNLTSVAVVGKLPTLSKITTLTIYGVSGLTDTCETLGTKILSKPEDITIGGLGVIGNVGALPAEGTASFILEHNNSVYGTPKTITSVTHTQYRIFDCARVHGSISSYVAPAVRVHTVPCVSKAHLDAHASALLASTPVGAATLSSRVDPAIITQLTSAGWSVVANTDPETIPTETPTLSYYGQEKALDVGFTQSLTGARFQYSSVEDFSSDVTTVDMELNMVSTSVTRHKIVDLCNQFLGYRWVRVALTGDNNSVSPWSAPLEVMLGAGDWVLPVEAGLFDVACEKFQGLKWTLPDGSTFTGDYLKRTVTPGLLRCSYTDTTIGEMQIYSSTALANAKVTLADMPKVGAYFGATNMPELTGSLVDIPRVTREVHLSQLDKITGNVSDLPQVYYTLRLRYMPGITGAFVFLPRVQHKLELTHLTGVSGDVYDLPTVDQELAITSVTGCTGNLGDLFQTGVVPNYTVLRSLPELRGSLYHIPRSVISFSMRDLPKVSGNVNQLPTTVENLLVLYDMPAIYGSLEDMPLSTATTITLINCPQVTGAMYIGPKLSSINFFGNEAVTPAQYDETIRRIAAGTVSNGKLHIDARCTSNSDADIATLISRGWTVTKH